MTLVERIRNRSISETLCTSMFLATTMISSVLIMGSMAPMAMAQQELSQSGQIDQVQFSIPSQPLDQALTTFGQQARLQVSVDPALVRGLRSHEINGTYAPIEALSALLSGLGVNYQIADGVVTLQKISDTSDGTLILPTVTVESRQAPANPYGPDDSIVASQTMVGTKTNTPLIKTPQSISIVTSKEIESRAAQNVNQSLRYAAGVVTDSSGVDDRFDSLTARGFSLNEYLDGTRLLSSSSGFAVPQLDPYLLERIEVLRGPSSVLYGSASPGGVVNLVSKRPTDEPLREVLLRGGSYGHKEVAFDVGGSVNEEGNVLFRVTGLGRETGTQVDHTQYQRFFIAPSITVRPNDDTDITFLLNYQYDPEAGFFNKLPPKGSGLPGAAGKIPRDFYAGDTDFDEFKRSLVSTGYNIEHRFSDSVTFRQNMRYLRMDTDFAAAFASGTVQADGHTLNRNAFVSDESLTNVTIDNQIEVEFDTGSLNHTTLFGFDYQWRRWSQDAGFGSAPTIDFLNPNHNQSISNPPAFADQIQRQTQMGIYAQDQIGYGGWSLLLSGRFDRASNGTDNHRTGVNTDHTDYDFTGRTGVSYLFDNGIAPYISYSESFEPTSGTDISGTPFSPTTGSQNEIGIKYQPPTINALLALSAYDLTQQNVLTPDPTNSNFNVQTGEIRSRGLELEGRASLSSNVSVTAAYAYVDAEVTKANNATKGKSPVGIPEHMASAWLDYGFDVGTMDGLEVGGGIRYLGKSFGDNANSFMVDDAMLFDAAIRYDLGGLDEQLSNAELSVNGSNLFDKEYIARCQDNGCYYGLGRSVIATLKYNW